MQRMESRHSFIPIVCLVLRKAKCPRNEPSVGIEAETKQDFTIDGECGLRFLQKVNKTNARVYFLIGLQQNTHIGNRKTQTQDWQMHLEYD